nr:EthD domain-containing protein [Nocardioides thalensis]
MSREDYLTYWQVHHTPIAIRTQNTCGYIQNIVEEALTPSTPEVAAIVEEHFPMAALTDPHEFYGSRGDDAELNRRMTELMDSVGRFGAGDGLDVVPTSRYFWAL